MVRCIERCGGSYRTLYTDTRKIHSYLCLRDGRFRQGSPMEFAVHLRCKAKPPGVIMVHFQHRGLVQQLQYADSDI